MLDIAAVCSSSHTSGRGSGVGVSALQKSRSAGADFWLFPLAKSVDVPSHKPSLKWVVAASQRGRGMRGGGLLRGQY